jgi:[ribosomal protein S5]-alanine N-acetyltransferase
MSTLLETDRLRLRPLTDHDAAFLLRLLNEPSFLENIGDKGVRTLDQARQFIRSGPYTSALPGYGMNVVELKEDGTPIGMCGLLKREHLDHPDVGYALVPEHWSRGYAAEAAGAVLRYARESLGLDTLLAVTSVGNDASARVLERVGFVSGGITGWTGGEQVRLFVSTPPVDSNPPIRT